jgi:hypothetical protein
MGNNEQTRKTEMTNREQELGDTEVTMHDEYCNCEDCWWARGQKEVCSECGSVGEGCPENREMS